MWHRGVWCKVMDVSEHLFVCTFVETADTSKTSACFYETLSLRIPEDGYHSSVCSCVRIRSSLPFFFFKWSSRRLLQKLVRASFIVQKAVYIKCLAGLHPQSRRRLAWQPSTPVSQTLRPSFLSSRDCSYYVSRPIPAPRPLWPQKHAGLRAHDFAHFRGLWHPPRFAKVICFWSWTLCGINSPLPQKSDSVQHNTLTASFFLVWIHF